MGYFNKEERFNELFNVWFDEDFMPWLARERYWSAYSYSSSTSEYLQGAAQAYALVDERIDGAILKMREQVNKEFEDWKKEQEE